MTNAPAMVNPMAGPVDPADAVPAAEPAPIAATPVDGVADGPVESDSTGILAGLAAALGLGGLALVMLRRRRRAPEADEVELLPVAASPAEAVVPEYAFYTPPLTETPVQPVVASPVVAPAATHTVAPAMVGPVPEGPVPDGEEREDLLNAMVAAEPDASNPFTSRKARRRRARLILQAREQQQGNAAAPFDWRTYSRPAGTVQAEKPTPVTV